MSGVGTIKGITFQTVQALSDVVDLVVEGHGEAVTIEGADDVALASAPYLEMSFSTL